MQLDMLAECQCNIQWTYLEPQVLSLTYYNSFFLYTSQNHLVGLICMWAIRFPPLFKEINKDKNIFDSHISTWNH